MTRGLRVRKPAAPPAKQVLQFDINVKAASTVSANVYNASGELVRNLFASRAYLGGVTQVLWDGYDDNKGIVANPLGCVIKYVANPVLDGMRAEWLRNVIGNTSPATGTGANTAAHFVPDGFWHGDWFHYAPGYSEGTAQCYLKAHRSSLSTRVVIGFHREHSVLFMCTDGQYGYMGGPHSHANMVTAIDLLNDDADVQFQYGTTLNISNSVYSAIDLDSNGDYVTGMAVQRAGNFLFLAHALSDEVRVLHKKTGQLLRTWSAKGIHNIKLANDNTLWGILADGTVQQFAIDELGMGTANGVTAGVGVVVEPRALAVSPTGELAITDGTATNDVTTTARHQVHFFDALTGAVGRGKLGETVGYSTNPNVTDYKFNFANTKDIGDGSYGPSKTFLAYAPDGALLVGDTGHLRCQFFSAGLDALLDQLAYLGYNYSVQVDPNNPRRVFAGFLEFDVSPDGSWRLVRDWSAGWQANFDDQQNRMLHVATLSNGRTYCLLQSQDRKVTTLPRQFVELTSTGLRYTGVFTPDYTYCLNSDGTLWNMSYGNLGQPQRWWKSVLTFDENHNPVIGEEVLVDSVPAITEFDPITAGGGLGRNQVTESGVIGTYNTDLPSFTGEGRGKGYHVGMVKNGKFFAKTSQSTWRGHRGGYPRNGKYEVGNRVQNGGSFMQCIGRFICTGYKGEYFQNAQTNCYNMFLDSGLLALSFGVWNSSSSRLPEGAPGIASNATTGTWVKIGADYYLYHCDEGFHAGVHQWRVTGMEKLEELQANMRLVAQQASNEVDLMGGLTYNSPLVDGAFDWTRFPLLDAPAINQGDTFPARNYLGVYDTEFDEPDLTTELNPQSSGNQMSWSKRRLPRLPAGATKWRIRGLMGWMNNSFDNASDFAGIRISSAGRTILEIQRREISYPNDYRLMVNGQTAGVLPVSDWHQLMRYLQNVTITAENGLLTVQFAGFDAITVAPLNPQANLLAPDALLVLGQTTTNRQQSATIRAFKFSTNEELVFA
jgi:hypothetical protein